MREPESQATLTIGAVAQRTGLSEHVIRAWERRHGVVSPARTAGGVRLYTNADVVRLRLLRRATEAGYSIGVIGKLGLDQLLSMSGEAEREEAIPRSVGDGAEYVRRCLQAVEALDGRGVHAILSSAVVSLSIEDFTEGVAVPLLHEVGALWSAGSLCAAHEHVFSAKLRAVLGWLLESVRVARDGPVVVVTTPSGERHEMGALLAAVTAAGAGWRVTYLGPDLPAADLATAVGVTGAAAVALSVVLPVKEKAFRREMEAIRAALPPAVVVTVGGAGAKPHSGLLPGLGMRWIGGFSELRSTLNEIHTAVGGTS